MSRSASSVQIPPTPEANPPFPHAASPAVCLPLLILTLVVIGLCQSRPRGSVASYKRRNSDAKLEAKLLNLLGGDHATASRLLDQAKDSHPNQTRSWYLEKVIWDLERDRKSW